MNSLIFGITLINGDIIPNPPRRTLGQSCGSGLQGYIGECEPGSSCKCVGECADPKISDSPSTCVKEKGDFKKNTKFFDFF